VWVAVDWFKELSGNMDPPVGGTVPLHYAALEGHLPASCRTILPMMVTNLSVLASGVASRWGRDGRLRCCAQPFAPAPGSA